MSDQLPTGDSQASWIVRAEPPTERRWTLKHYAAAGLAFVALLAGGMFLGLLDDFAESEWCDNNVELARPHLVDPTRPSHTIEEWLAACHAAYEESKGH